MEELLVISHPTQNRLTYLANTDLTTLIGNAVHAWSLELSNPLQYTEHPKTLSLAASILPDSNNEKMQLILKTLMALCIHIKMEGGAVSQSNEIVACW